MRQVLAGLASAALAVSAVPAQAQQGSVQVSAAAQAITGAPERIAGQHLIEPDFGLTWVQPRTRFGIFQMEIRGARRQDRLHPGKMFVALRDVNYYGIAWSIEAGDTYFAPAIGEYKFSNIFTPAVTFNGASVTGRTRHTSLLVVAGKTSAWRNIFGSDPETLGQALGAARLTHKRGDRVELSARASRVSTTNLKEFNYGIATSDQAGGGTRVWLKPSLQVAADASVVSYRRVGSDRRERDFSGMIGTSWLHSRGWLQVNASRFSPGDFPTLNSPLPDREGVFVAGDYDLASRLRIFGGWDVIRSNLNLASAQLSANPRPRGSGMREFGGARLQLSARSAFTVRAEKGARVSRPLAGGIGSDSDTGSWAAELQAAAGSFTSFTRYSRRNNVDRMNGMVAFNQQDFSAQIFANVSAATQLFGSMMATRTELAEAGGSTHWQAGGGGQLKVPGRDLWLRAEGTLARNVDLLTQNFVPRESLSVGVNGQMTRNTTIALNVNVDRSPMAFGTGSPWRTRSTLRVTRTLPTGDAYVNSTAAVSEAVSGRGTGSVTGTVYADWNGNGEHEADELVLEGIPVRIGTANLATTGRDGQFSFLNVPVGTREVGLDTGSLPLDFDPPEIAQVELQLSRGDTKRVSFGLRPLGTIEGRVTRDANGNGRADPGEEAMDGAIVILDGGARSEQVRDGQFQFASVRSGRHSVTLLLESLPEGAVIAGEAQVDAALTRDRMTVSLPFLVSVEKRPEIRKVFPPKRGGGAAAARRPSSGTRTSSSAARPGGRSASRASGFRGNASRRTPTAAAPTGAFAVQIAALTERANVPGLIRQLESAGLTAFVVPPSSPDDALYRVRVGPYRTRAEANRAVDELEQAWGSKLWVVRGK